MLRLFAKWYCDDKGWLQLRMTKYGRCRASYNPGTGRYFILCADESHIIDGHISRSEVIPLLNELKRLALDVR